MKLRPARLALLAVTLASLPAPHQLAAATGVHVSVRLEPHQISLGETARLVIEARADGLTNPDFEASFELRNLEVVAGPSRSQQMQFGTGGAHRSLALIWRLAPQEAGPASVTTIRVQTGGRTLSLPEQRLTVVDQPAQPAPTTATPSSPIDPLLRLFEEQLPRPEADDDSRLPDVFLRAEVTPERPYVGQKAVWRLVLFSQSSISGISPRQLPDFPGFWVEEVPAPARPQVESVQLEGRRYGRALLLERILYPLDAGRHVIGPAEFELQLDSPFEGFLTPFARRERVIDRASNRVAVEVRPLPDPPARFSGAVGTLTAAATLQPSSVSAGEAATLTVTASGQGRLAGMRTPALPPLSGVRAYAATERLDREGGAMRWTWLLIPERPGSWTLPPFRFDYFDPAREEYGTAASQPLSLRATPVPQQATPRTAAVAGAPRPPDRIRPGLAVAAATTVGLGLLLAWGLARRRRNEPPTPFTEALEASRTASRPRHAARQVEAAWRDLLQARFGLPGSQPRGGWPDWLAGRGCRLELVTRFREILSDLDYLFHAPELASADELRNELIRASTELARDLPEVLPGRPD